jgi:hypothetical protein
MSDGARTEGIDRAGESNLPLRWSLTKVINPVHAGESGVKAVVNVYAKEITRLKNIALIPGQYNLYVSICMMDFALVGIARSLPMADQ